MPLLLFSESADGFLFLLYLCNFDCISYLWALKSPVVHVTAPRCISSPARIFFLFFSFPAFFCYIQWLFLFLCLPDFFCLKSAHEVMDFIMLFSHIRGVVLCSHSSTLTSPPTGWSSSLQNVPTLAFMPHAFCGFLFFILPLLPFMGRFSIFTSYTHIHTYIHAHIHTHCTFKYLQCLSFWIQLILFIYFTYINAL